MTSDHPIIDIDPAILDDLVAANHILAHENVLDAFGHVSIRHPGHPDRYLLSRSGEVAPAYVEAADIMEYDLDSNPLDLRGRKLHSERFIHGEIYKLRPEVSSVVHSHSRAVIPFSVTEVPLRAIFHNAAFLGAGAPVWEIRETVGERNAMLVDNAALGASLGRTLGEGAVALMRGHGDVVVGATLQIAVFRAIYTEVNAAMQIQAATLGGPVKYLNEWESRKGQVMERAWVAWKRRAKGE